LVRLTAVAVSLSLALAGAGAFARAQATPAPVAGAPPPPVFAISGRGFGHGVGMSQYGAFGLAQAGTAYTTILAHYYPGTQLGPAPLARVRVLLADGRAGVRIGSGAPLTVRGAGGAVCVVPAGTHALDASLRVPTDSGAIALRAPLVFSAGAGAPLQLDGRRYRGTLEVDVVGGRLHVVNAVPLEQYLFGVVPREVPSRWPEEALKAQAVAARSYALAVRRSGSFDLYADVRSQVYGGMDAEQAATNTAVLATAGEVLLHGGRVATAFFFSTSGGRTANVADVWPGSTPVPYLVSVEDPADAVSPHHTWGPIPVTAARLRSVLRAPGALVDVRTTTTPSGRVAQVVGIGPSGRVTTPAASVRTALGLRSTWFEVGVLAFDRPPRATVTSGAQLRLSGTARGPLRAVLEERAGGGSWRAVGPVAPGADGRFAAVVRLAAPSQYRLASGSLRTGPLAVAVAPAVRLDAPASPNALGGTVRPGSLAGVTVAIDRSTGAGWRRVATSRVDAEGEFSVPLVLSPGRYRAVVPAARGFAAGSSPPLDVVAP
jgi:stage II sporulation protein D